MRHAQIELWSRQRSVIHRRHAAAKIIGALSLLVCIATLTHAAVAACILYFFLLLILARTARLPLRPILTGSAAVLPFALCFAVISMLGGDVARAAMLVVRAYLSAFTGLVLIATTPMPDLISGLESLRVPAYLLQVMQFLYRYLLVLMEEAQSMRQAGSTRAGTIHSIQFRQAAAAAGVLFARSYARAEAIHRAMVARGFEGRMPAFVRVRFHVSDAAFAAGAAALAIGVRAAF